VLGYVPLAWRALAAGMAAAYHATKGTSARRRHRFSGSSAALSVLASDRHQAKCPEHPYGTSGPWSAIQMRRDLDQACTDRAPLRPGQALSALPGPAPASRPRAQRRSG
jgi:hypothetical protein